MTVPTAAPMTPRAGAPNLPKMNTQLKNRFRKKATRELISGTFTCPVLRSSVVTVVHRPLKTKVQPSSRR